MSGITAETLFDMAHDVARFRRAVQLGRFQPDVAPTFRVQSVALGDRAGRVVVQFGGAEGGIDPNSLDGNVRLIRTRPVPIRFDTTLIGEPTVLPNVYLPVQNRPEPSNPTIGAVFDFGQPLPPGGYRLEIDSGGVRDLCGRPLDGEFDGLLPSGDGRPGGDFEAALATNGFFSYRPRAVAFGRLHRGRPEQFPRRG